LYDIRRRLTLASIFFVAQNLGATKLEEKTAIRGLNIRGNSKTGSMKLRLVMGVRAHRLTYTLKQK